MKIYLLALDISLFETARKYPVFTGVYFSSLDWTAELQLNSAEQWRESIENIKMPCAFYLPFSQRPRTFGASATYVI